MNEVILDTNVFILYIIGLINPNKISNHKRTAIYNLDDFNYLKSIVSQYKAILTSPNIVTEIDNLLNGFSGNYKYKYNNIITKILNSSIEKYHESKIAVVENNWIFYEIGLTDAIIIEMAKESDLLISDDSRLCDIAKSFNINVFDLKEYINIIRFS